MTHEELYTKFVNDRGDISDHLATLRRLAGSVSSVVELGVRGGVSTLALLLGKPKLLTSFDINHFAMEPVYKKYAEYLEVNFKFIQENVLTTDKITECDLLFIDTMHSFDQMSCELYLHGNKAKKYLVFHDTVSFGSSDEGKLDYNELPSSLKDMLLSTRHRYGILPAINNFMLANRHWTVAEVHNNNNGLLVLERKDVN
jgi:predicted O-methyltransferase YrrM